ncbi:MAG: hypothetical protein ABI906_00770 [Pseudomonadota bacterium]
MLLQLLIAAATALGPAPAAGQAPGRFAPGAAPAVATLAIGKAQDPSAAAEAREPRRPGFGLVCGPVPDGLRDIGWQHGRCLDATDAAALALLAPSARPALSTGAIFL